MVSTNLFDCWHARDLQKFRVILKGSQADKATSGGNSASYSKSPHSHSFNNNGGQLGWCPPAELNKNDSYGRSVLHLIASNTDPIAIDFVYAVLSHPSVNLNLQDVENGWTPLHRALYAANLQIAILFLRRSDIDTCIKDLEGLTAFDLYNSTVAGTNPSPSHDAKITETSRHTQHIRTLMQLFTWGSNRNYSLGLGDGDDRAVPDRVSLQLPSPSEWQQSQSLLSPGKKFDRIGIRDVVMSRFHTVVVTDENSCNVWVGGLGGNGRLGRSPQTQLVLQPLCDFQETARFVAVSQDHTIIVTVSGAVYTFGLNRFSQLGYTIEHGQGIVASTAAKMAGSASASFGQAVNSAVELDVQISPRRIAGPLKKQLVLGAAASKLHSVVFTADGLYTWGTNTGQLGYERSATPVQLMPRRVTAIAAAPGIKQVAATEFGTACLMESWEVIVWHNDTHYRINFSRFSSNISVFRPRQVQPKPRISKLTSGGNTFAALSNMGDVFTFNLEHPSEYGTSVKASFSNTSTFKTSSAQAVPKSQLLWSVRKKFTAVRDVAIGSDGSVILCTESGHCYVRSRKGIEGSAKSIAKSFKFQQIPHLQRVVKVAINENGGLAAIKADPSLPDVRIKGRTIQEALRDLLPHLKVQTLTENSDMEKEITSEMVGITDINSNVGHDSESEDEESDAPASESENTKHIRIALLIAEAANRWIGGREMVGPNQQDQDPQACHGRNKATLAFFGPHNLTPAFGCDAFLIAGGHYLPVHRVVLAARIPLLSGALANPTKQSHATNGIEISAINEKMASLVLPNCSFASALFFLHYIYSDDLPPVWTAGIGLSVQKELRAAGLERAKIQQELRGLADLLNLSALAQAVQSHIPRSPTSTLRQDLEAFFSAHVDVEKVDSSLFHDVELEFKDRLVPAHSTMLRRSPFFAALFQPHWTVSRWNENNVITINMKHLTWSVARIILLHLYTDQGESLFVGADQDRTMEQYMDFLVEVMAASNELLLDKLKLVCSSLIRKRILSQNVGAVMTEADFYNADQLKDITMEYCTKSMETLLQGGMLEELEYKILKDLTRFVRQRQDEKMHRKLASDRLSVFVEKHRHLYDLVCAQPRKEDGPLAHRSPAINPTDPGKKKSSVEPKIPSSPFTSPQLRPIGSLSKSATSNDPSLLFSMDEDDLTTPKKNSVIKNTSTGSPWASLSQIAHLSLDEAAESSSCSTPSTPWKVGNAEAAENRTHASRPSPSPSLEPIDGLTDLRSIMAQQQQSVKRTNTTPSPSSSGATTPMIRSTSSGFEISPLTMVITKLSQRDRKRQAAAAAAATASVGTNTNGASKEVPSLTNIGSSSLLPWKIPSNTASVSTSQGSPSGNLWGTKASVMARASLHEGDDGTGPPSIRGTCVTELSALPELRKASSSSHTQLGPTYTIPSKMQTKSLTRRMTGGEPVWSAPSLSATNSFLSTAAPSFPSLFATSVPEATTPEPAHSNLYRSLNGHDTNGDQTSTQQQDKSPSRGSLQTDRSSTNLVSCSSTSNETHRASTPLTFAQIQEQQTLAEKEELERAQVAAKKSFLEIQEEERREKECKKELRQQAEFERWFEEESRRVQEEVNKVKKSTKTIGDKVSNKVNSNSNKGSASASASGKKGGGASVTQEKGKSKLSSNGKSGQNSSSNNKGNTTTTSTKKKSQNSNGLNIITPSSTPLDLENESKGKGKPRQKQHLERVDKNKSGSKKKEPNSLVSHSYQTLEAKGKPNPFQDHDQPFSSSSSSPMKLGLSVNAAVFTPSLH